MSKHTHGPWTTEPHGNTTALYSGRDNNYHGARLMNLDDGDMNFEANVRLIASAPELLEALKLALDALGGNDPQDLGFEDSICGKIRQAIAKAEGTL